MYVPVFSPAVAGSGKVFYSRRGNGPYYCWCYEETNQKWKVSRVLSHDFVVQPLSLATWKTVPSALQSRLSDHYLD
jgi:hypothetical protein